MSPFSIVTSVNQKIINQKHQHVITSTQKHLPDVDFYIYNENSFLKENVNIDGALNFDLFKEIKGLEHFLSNSPFKECHKIGKKDPNKYLNNPDEYLSSNHYWNRNSIFWFRKICSIYHCSKICKSNILIWLDSDVSVQKKIDSRFVDFVSSYDLCSISRRNFNGWMFTDMGVVCYNLMALGRSFINTFYDMYRSESVFTAHRWDDCYIFDLLVEINKKTLSCCGLNKTFGAPLDYEEYFFHDKGHRGG